MFMYRQCQSILSVGACFQRMDAVYFIVSLSTVQILQALLEETSAYPTSSQLLISHQTGSPPPSFNCHDDDFQSIAKSVKSPFVTVVLFFEA